MQEGIATAVILAVTGVGFYVYGWLWADRKLKKDAEALGRVLAPIVQAKPEPKPEPKPGLVKRLAVGEDEV